MSEKLTGLPKTTTLADTDLVYVVTDVAGTPTSKAIDKGDLDQDISGIATNASAITTIQGEQTTQDAAIALNTAKDGITAQQASDITTNNAKISYTDSAAVALNTAKVGVTNEPSSDPTGVTGADAISNIMSLTQAEFDAIVTPDASTYYLITDA